MSTERFLNLGKDVETAAFGKVTVKELTFEQTLRATKDILKVLISTANVKESPQDFLFKLLENEDTAKAVKAVLAMSINKKAEELDNLPAKDMLKLLVAFKEVVDWEELKQLFFQLVPKEQLQNLVRQ